MFSPSVLPLTLGILDSPPESSQHRRQDEPGSSAHGLQSPDEPEINLTLFDDQIEMIYSCQTKKLVVESGFRPVDLQHTPRRPRHHESRHEVEMLPSV